MKQNVVIGMAQVLIKALRQSTLPRRHMISSVWSCLPHLNEDSGWKFRKPIRVSVLGRKMYVWSVEEFLEIIYYNYLTLNAFVGLKKIRTVVDAGAHVGLMSVLFSYLYPEAAIYAFEPEPSNLELLKRNTDIWPQMYTFNLALGPVGAYSVELYRQESQAATILDSLKHSTQEPIEVGAIDASSLFDLVKRPIDLFKIDIEGAEYGFLNGVNWQTCNVGYFYIEFHSKGLKEFPRIIELLGSASDCYLVGYHNIMRYPRWDLFVYECLLVQQSRASREEDIALASQ